MVARRGPHQVFSDVRAGHQGGAAHIALVCHPFSRQHVALRLSALTFAQCLLVALDTTGDGNVGDQMRQSLIIGLRDLQFVPDPFLVMFLPKSGQIQETAVRKVNIDKINYNFGDGWGANVELRLVTSKKCKEMIKKSKSNFQSYEWMVDSIIHHNEILNTNQIKELQNSQF